MRSAGEVISDAPVRNLEGLGRLQYYDTGDVGKSADSNWFELAWHPTSELGRNPHRYVTSLSGQLSLAIPTCVCEIGFWLIRAVVCRPMHAALIACTIVR